MKSLQCFFCRNFKGEISIKIRVIGSCGSGKSYISRALAEKYGIKYYELDNLVWDRSEKNKRYPIEVRDTKLLDVLNEKSWIIEGVHWKWTVESFRQADFIFILRPNVLIRDYRVIRRFITTRIGIEQWNYKQSFNNLIEMLKWNRKYDQKDMKKIMELTSECKAKRFIVGVNEDIINHIEEILMSRRIN